VYSFVTVAFSSPPVVTVTVAGVIVTS
jgi:hypothetical protein